MRFSKALTKPGVKITGSASGWMTVTREEAGVLTDRIIAEETGSYREGIFTKGAEESYRAKRVGEVCRENAWLLVEHVRQGNINGMEFEETISPPVEVKISGGKKVLITGKIDRVDVLADGSVKIIDYKSGKERFNIDEAKAGWRLQLMLYLKAAQREKAEPAGVFYFTIDERVENGRMDGVVVNKTSVIESIAGDFQNYSNIIPVRKLQDGAIKGNRAGNLLSESEFKELQDSVDKKVRLLCDELISGSIDIRPKRSGDMTACTYCGYKSICSFDIALDGFKYENI
jgi:ATP-dependent helicase/nuclease subunit B